MSVQILFLLGFLLLLRSPPPAAAESPNCLAVYRSGGAPAVFRSPKCPRWTLLPSDDPRRPPPPSNCQIATHQGRRRSQEDRALCALDIRIPFLGRGGVKEVSVSVIAVFDGHNGAEASDMASRFLLEYFLLHVYFLLDEIYPVALRLRLTFDGEYDGASQLINTGELESWHDSDTDQFAWRLPSIFDDAFHMEILKKSLLRTVHDIDATFCREASRKNLESGSTATVILIADGQILTANLGDSKALLCSERTHMVSEQKGNWSKLNRLRRRRSVASSVKEFGNFKLSNSDGSTYYVKELTKDHHPGRDDERNRIEASGGYVVEWAGVLRVNGELAVSRAIGDIPFKNYGVISTPEVTDWKSLSSNDSYLVAASDGIFEKLTTQEVCNVLWDEKIRATMNSKFVSTITNPLADSIVNAAFERGSMDNLAIVVLPLGLRGISGTCMDDGCDLEGISTLTPFAQQQVIPKNLENDAIPTSLIQMDYFNQIISKFNRMLVETQYRGLGCFYLSENLNENMDYVFGAPKNYRKDEMPDFDRTLPEPLGSYHGLGLLDLYNDKKMCWHFGFHDGDKGHCTSPEVFAKFLGLLDSVPYSDDTSNSSESFGYKFPDFRYGLRKRFDRGSYGEVWLAFHWNCSQENDALNEMNNRSSTQNCFTDCICDNMFILKRIMVERGATAYLSGLREKYFGETFLNASASKNISKVGEYCLNATDSSYTNSRTIDISFEEGLEHIARYIEYFESDSKEIWLVFRNEGMSLSKLIYKAEEIKFAADDESNEPPRNILLLHPSSWWHWLKTTESGNKEMQNLIWQLLLAVKSCHDRNITHRDIKPENMIICFEDVQTGRCLRKIPSGEKHYHLKMRIIDFGSAIDEVTLKYLYGSGPTRSEQTYEYTPPEALLNASWFQATKSVRLKYDMWSVGVVMLELILGTPHVFQISDRNRALLDQHLSGWSDHTKELAYKLRSYMEMCILIPGISPQHQDGGIKDHNGVSPASWKCSEESFSSQVKSRDPLKLGFPNVWALRLVRQLLVWHPEDRLSVDDALRHPYFQKHP